MADLNALIAQGAQFNMPDQLGQYAKMQQLQAGQQQMQLGQQQMRTSALQEQNAGMQLQKLQEDRANIAKLSQMLAKDGITPRQYFQAFQQSNDPQHQKLGIEGLMTLDATEAFNRSQQTIPAGQAPEPMAGGLGTGRFGIDNIPGMPNALASRAAPMASTNALAPAPAAADPVAAIEAEMRRIQPFVLSGATGAKEAMARLEKRLELASKRYTVNNTLMNQMGDVLGTAPAAPVLPFTPDVEAQRIRIANASRAPLQPVAPTVTTIQDPTNPNQMISINARDYRGGGIGAPGVIGLTGKTPAATAKQDVIDKGQAQLSSVLDDLRASYDTLDKSAAIPSTQRGTLSNLAASAQASGIGQALGRMGGTEEQSARDTINSSRMMLLNSIKQATGMSAQQLNSNVELTSWLKAVSDPTQSIETVNKILGNIEKFVASGGKYSAKKEGKITPSAASAGVDTSNPLLKIRD